MVKQYMFVKERPDFMYTNKEELDLLNKELQPEGKAFFKKIW